MLSSACADPETSTSHNQLEADIETCLRDLERSVFAYVNHTAGPVVAPGRLLVEVRSAPESSLLSDALYCSDGSVAHGLSGAKSFLRPCQPLPSSMSQHQRLKVLKIEHSIKASIESLRGRLSGVPILRHDTLQLNAGSFLVSSGAEGMKHCLQLSVDGIAIQTGTAGSRDAARDLARNLAGLSILRPDQSDSWPEFWPIFKVQGHIVRAPGPGWAWLKLHALTLRTPLTSESLATIVASEAPEVSILSPRSAILADIAHLTGNP